MRFGLLLANFSLFGKPVQNLVRCPTWLSKLLRYLAHQIGFERFHDLEYIRWLPFLDELASLSSRSLTSAH